MCSERSWAMAMELKQEVNSDPRKKFHLLRRLKRAAKYANQLLSLSEACVRCDARTRLEAQVTLTVHRSLSLSFPPPLTLSISIPVTPPSLSFLLTLYLLTHHESSLSLTCTVHPRTKAPHTHTHIKSHRLKFYFFS